MTDYWKSQERKYCDFCKCWISDNKASFSHHENGKRHKLNVAKRLTEVSQRSERDEKEKQKFNQQLRKMEEAAMLSYASDISARSDMTARTISAVVEGFGPTVDSCSDRNTATTESSISASHRQVDPLRFLGNSDDEDDSNRPMVKKMEQLENIPNASLWVEGKSPDGYTYYWNVKTNKSVWDKPKEGFLSLDEYNRINEIAKAQQQLAVESEAKKFRNNVNEEVARYNREKLKAYRQPEKVAEAKAQIEERAKYRTAEEAAAQVIGEWQVVQHKPEAPQIDWELPITNTYYPEPISVQMEPEPPVKRFKEKTIVALDPSIAAGTSTTFKKRKFACKSNARQRLDDD